MCNGADHNLIEWTQQIFSEGKLIKEITRFNYLGERKTYRGISPELEHITIHTVFTENGWCRI